MTDELFFDTDCLSAFLWINDTNILHELYGGRIVLPEPVYQELSNPSIPHIKQRADIMINSKDVSVKTIDTGTEEYKLYVELVRGKMGQKSIGRGEADGNSIWSKMLAKKRKLPGNTFSEYLASQQKDI